MGAGLVVETLNLEDLLAEIASEEATNFGLPIMRLSTVMRTLLFILYVSEN